jgi:DNA-binding response OmpR family regulator
VKNRVLVVEDDPTLLRLERDILLADGFEVDIATDGHEAWGKLQADTYEVIVLDIKLPGIDGHELATRVKGSRAHHDTPIIMVTGAGDRDALKVALAEGATLFVNKPFTAAGFRSAIRTVAR